MKYRKRISQVPLPEPVHGKSKKIKVWENGSSECHVFNINPKDFRTWGIVLHHISHILHPTFGAVKKLIDLKTKKEVKDFEQLDPKQKYIATGFNDKLKEPIRGYKTHAELLKAEREATQRSPIYSETGRVTHNWEFLKQTEKLRNTVVYVALNGTTTPPQKAVFRESEMGDTNLISSYCSKMLGMPDGISHFCTIYGRILQDPKDFQHGYLYVAVPYGETFVKMDYMALFKKHYNYKKTKKPKIPSIIVRPHSSVHSRCSRRTVKSVGKSGKSRKSRTAVTDNSTKTKSLSYKTKNFDPVPKKKNKLTNVDSKLASERELKITYYTQSEQNHRPSFKARTVSSIPHQNFVPKRSDIRKPSFHTSTITLSPEDLIRSNEAGCMSDEDHHHDETTIEQENYKQIIYEQQQFEKANTDTFCEREINSIRTNIIDEPVDSKQTVKKVCKEKKYPPTKVVQDCQQLVVGLWYDQATKGIKNGNEDVDNIEQNNQEMQLINYQEPIIGVTLKLPDGGKQPHATRSCEQNTITWRELGEKEQKQKTCSDDIIYKINKSNTSNPNDHIHLISDDDSTRYEQIEGQAIEEQRQENGEPEEEENSKNSEYNDYNKQQSYRQTNERDSLNSFKSDDNLNYYYVKLVNEGNQTMFRKIESRDKYVQNDMRRQSCGHKPRSRKCERENILSSVTEPILTLSQQIMEADSSIAVTYHAQSRQRNKKSLPRSFKVKDDQSDLQRNVYVESNKKALHSDEYCKKSKKTLSQLILSVSKTIRTYQDILKEIEKDIADDPIAQRLMRKIKKGSSTDTKETHKSTYRT